ncbi:biopolymer transporter ExbD [Hanstruepera neustonica]|uniref:Biopolymer transporter ExbD n=1 Tax=Hanstruepera neustonica TaxID=1445657 RepID=A0A2K1DYK3_9FLAO|nr:biopolymer transporter ExbD [Hanstruepera neustonica]PNQ73102.1 biopolymer transporter ExbD [Hanstruepera neustonica]
MKNYRNSEKVNAGSMADIAFLLLIFFLVTTTIATDIGINRQLPDKCPDHMDCTKTIAEQNILRIVLNSNQDILLNDELTALDQLKENIIKHIDNNGDKTCTYCQGASVDYHSDNPKKAFVNIQHSRDTSYELFVSVQDEISKAYNDLRTQYAQSLFRKPLSELTYSELKQVQDAYPIQMGEQVSN